MSLTPAHDELEARKKKEAIEKCGKNMGPHDYIPISWSLDPQNHVRNVTRLLCRVCFCNISVSVLIENYQEIKA